MSIRDLAAYPWAAVEPYRQRAAEHPRGPVDLSIGSPVDPTPGVVSRALAAASDAHAYPSTQGSVALRESIAGWYARRRGVPCVTADDVLPTVGSKEFVALLPTLLGLGGTDVVVHPSIAYPTYAVGAAVASIGAVAADDPDHWPESTRLVWVNTPGNPDGRVLDVDALQRMVRRARDLGAVIASDECYAELGWQGRWADKPVPSILDPCVTGGDLAGVLSVYSLSKQSNLAGYRAAFVAGDRGLIARLLDARKHLGLMVPTPVQAAMIAALTDDRHVAEQRERYRARRGVLARALDAAGYRIDHSEAGLYLWATLGEDAWQTMARLADSGIVAGPGPFYGPGGAQHIRFSLTGTDETVREAADRLSG